MAVRPIDAGSLRDNITDIYGGSDRLIYLADVLSLIDAQPTLTPPNEWVNRNVCLPEWQVDVLVLYDSGKIDINWVDSVGEFMYENIYGRVTHWMPLPAPPAGGGS